MNYESLYNYLLETNTVRILSLTIPEQLKIISLKKKTEFRKIILLYKMIMK